MLPYIIPALAYYLIKFISSSLRLELINAEYLLEEKNKGRNYIFAFWHNQIFAIPYFYKTRFSKYTVSVLTSLSRDGEYISRTIQKFGLKPIRGSSSRGGDVAIRLLLRQLQDGNDVAVTPDGPRGPRHIVQPGIITLAQLSGCPIIPMGYKTAHKKILNTWDRFIIPYPFSRIKLIIGDPILVPKDAEETEMEKIRVKLQEVLLSISED